MTPQEIESMFSKAMSERQGLLNQIDERIARLAFLAGERDNLKLSVKRLEAMVMVNGGTEEHAIDGKNETIRKAQYEYALHEFKPWRDAIAPLEGTIAESEETERGIDLLKSAIRAKDFQLQFCIEQFTYLNTPRFYRET